MTTPINPLSGTPIPAPTTDKTKSQQTSSSSSEQFSVATDGTERPVMQLTMTKKAATTGTAVAK